MTATCIAFGNPTTDRTFEIINRKNAAANEWFEITEDDFNYFLNVMPPLAWSGGSFAMVEFYSGNLTSSFHQIGDRFFSGLVAYINPSAVPTLRELIERQIPSEPAEAVVAIAKNTIADFIDLAVAHEWGEEHATLIERAEIFQSRPFPPRGEAIELADTIINDVTEMMGAA